MNRRLNVPFTIVTLLSWLLAPMSSSLVAPLPTWGPSMFLQSGEGRTDPGELEAFMDAYLAGQMEMNHVAEAVISVVKDGEVFFAKGFVIIAAWAILRGRRLDAYDVEGRDPLQE